ncbi:hypothetical protein AB0N05_38370 [Nocardia sp. NPDC051030]|uniref:hypothetical protein n=1 Tax=Nocardia sp. NPDC051030 TaxID=3155162 RepID=UPI00343D3095
MSEQDLSDADRYAEETGKVLDAVWNSWGRLDPEMAAERYQSRFIPAEIWQNMGVQETEPPSVESPSFAVVRRAYGVLLTTYGLSFPDRWNHDGDPVNGVGVELYAAASGVPADGRPHELVTETWLGQTVWHVAKTVTEHGLVFTQNLERYGTLSLSLPGLQLPEEAAGTYLDANGDACVLLGMAGDEVPDTVDGPLGSIRLVNIKLLTVAETEFCVSGGTGVTDARGELAQRFATQRDPLWSSITRPSVA